MRLKDVVVIGDINVDLIFYIDEYPRRGGAVTARKAEIHFGGVGANISVALSKLGLNVGLIGGVGKDLWGKFVLRELGKNKVNVDYVRQLEAPTGLMVVVVDRDGERTIIGDRGANKYYTWRESTEKYISTSRALHVSGYTLLNERQSKLSLKALEIARRNEVLTSMDLEGIACKWGRKITGNLRGLVDFLLMNEEEASSVSISLKVDELSKFREEIKARAVVVKMAEKGCMLYSDEMDFIQAFKVKAVDSTGAGDAFNAGFLYGVLKGLSLHDACMLGNAVAAYKCMGRGARHLPTLKQLEGWNSELRRELQDLFI